MVTDQLNFILFGNILLNCDVFRSVVGYVICQSVNYVQYGPIYCLTVPQCTHVVKVCDADVFQSKLFYPYLNRMVAELERCFSTIAVSILEAVASLDPWKTISNGHQ